jgi:hypothetical protein
MSLIPIFVLIVLALMGALVGLVVTLLNRRKRRGLIGPACGKCGYSVIGLTTMTCPECGGDLRACGIVTPNSPRGTSPVAGYIFFTVSLTLFALIVSGALFSVIPVRLSYDRQVQLVGPFSKSYQRVVIHAREATWGEARNSLPVEIELFPKLSATAPASMSPIHPARLTVRPGDGYEYGVGSVRVSSHEAFGADAVLAWMKAAGIDADNTRVRQEAGRIAGRAHAASRGGASIRNQGRNVGMSSSMSSGGDMFSSISMTESAESYPPAFVPIVLVAFWIGVWIAGLVYLSGRGRRPIGQRADDPGLPCASQPA